MKSQNSLKTTQLSSACTFTPFVGRDSSVGIETRYWLDGRGSNRLSRLPRGLGRWSVATCLLGLRVRIPQGAWIFVLCFVSTDKMQNARQSTLKTITDGVQSTREHKKKSRPAPGTHPSSWTWIPRLFPGVKRPGRCVNHPPSCSSEVKERVELYLYSPSGPSWPVLGRHLPLPFLPCI